MPDPAIAVAVFLAAGALDFAAARYTGSMLAHERGGGWRALERAGRWSATMALLSTVAVVALVDAGRWTIVPECAGLYVGTLASGWRRRHRADAHG
jgi:hypothetical protein